MLTNLTIIRIVYLLHRFVPFPFTYWQFMDTVDKNTRSRMMSRVRSKGNKSTERRLRAALIQAAISGWRLHPKHIEGKPDFFFPQDRLVVFVDGCFWHGCAVCGRQSKSRTEFWNKKREQNRARDDRVNEVLRNGGFNVLRVWEHELKDDLAAVVKRIDAMRFKT